MCNPDELTEYTNPTYGSPYYDIDEVDALISKKNAKIAELKKQLEDALAGSSRRPSRRKL